MIKSFRIIFALTCILLISGCSFVASRVIPLNDIKSPTGDYAIGTQTFYWIDQDREEWFTEIEGDKRELIVQAWYPSSKENIHKSNYTLFGMTFSGDSKSITPINDKVSWMDYSSQRTESIIENFKVPRFIAKAVDRIDTDTFKDAVPLSEGVFPVIIFSHGFEGFRSQNTTQIQDLVSNGYIVFSLDHTYDAVLTIFPDGREISTAKRYCRDCKTEDFYRVFLPQIDTRIADVRFLINQIEKSNWVYDKMISCAAIILTGLSFNEKDKYLNFGLSLLKKIINFSFDNQNFPKSRNVRQLNFYLKYFVLIREWLKESQNDIQEYIDEAIYYLGQSYSLIWQSIKKNILFNGNHETNNSDFDNYLSRLLYKF